MSQHMTMGQVRQPAGMMMMDQRALESQRIRSLLNFGARKQLQKMMSSPNLGASNSNLMAVMIHQQQQQQQQQQRQQQMSPLEHAYSESLSGGMNFGPQLRMI
jgi:ABC-type lipopolysaccharide export system ATPase subunit